MSMEFKVRTWLWIVLATVIVLGGGFTYWYVYGSKSDISPKTSPTPTKSAVTSPGTSPGTTSTPTSEKTATPSATQTPTPTAIPIQTPPAGWKVDNNSIMQGGGNVVSASYQVFIKDSWTARNNGILVTWPNSIQFYGDDPKCGTSAFDGSMSGDYCYLQIRGGAEVNDSNNRSYAIPNSSKYLIITFNPAKPLSESDKDIILNSLQFK